MKQANWWPNVAGVVLLVVAIRVGLKLPDIDQKVSFLSHRSLLTHGLLLPLLGLYLARRHLDSPLSLLWRLFFIGLCVALTVHLGFDLFPRAWRGFALIQIPFYGRTGALFSQLWIAASCVAGLYLALRLIRTAWELLPSAAALPIAFVQHLQQSPHEPFLNTLLALIVAAALALALPSNGAVLLRIAGAKHKMP